MSQSIIIILKAQTNLKKNYDLTLNLKFLINNFLLNDYYSNNSFLNQDKVFTFRKEKSNKHTDIRENSISKTKI